MIKMSLYSSKMDDEDNGFDHINKFNELVSRHMMHETITKMKRNNYFCLLHDPNLINHLLQPMLAGNSTQQLHEVVRSLKERQQMMDVDKSLEDNQILVTKDHQRRSYGDQHDRRF